MSTNDKSGGGAPDSLFSRQLRNPRAWFALVIVILALAFILQNRDSVQINLLMLTLSTPQWLTFTLLFLAGMLTGRLLAGRKRR